MESTREANILNLFLTNDGNMIIEVEGGGKGQQGNNYQRKIELVSKWEVTLESNLVLVPDFRRAKDLKRYIEEVYWETLGLGEGQDCELGSDG